MRTFIPYGIQSLFFSMLHIKRLTENNAPKCKKYLPNSKTLSYVYVYVCMCVYSMYVLERQHLIYTLTRFIKIKKINPEVITINFLKILEDRIRLLHQVL